MGPCQGMSDSVRAAEALMKDKVVLAKDRKTSFTLWKPGESESWLTCVDSQHIWIIDTINCQQVTEDLQETWTNTHTHTHGKGDILHTILQFLFKEQNMEKATVSRATDLSIIEVTSREQWSDWSVWATQTRFQTSVKSLNISIRTTNGKALHITGHSVIHSPMSLLVRISLSVVPSSRLR